MAFTTATSIDTVYATKAALIAAVQALDKYVLVSNPSVQAAADTACTAAKAAITTLQT